MAHIAVRYGPFCSVMVPSVALIRARFGWKCGKNGVFGHRVSLDCGCHTVPRMLNQLAPVSTPRCGIMVAMRRGLWHVGGY